MLEREGRSGPVKNIDVVYTRGAVQLARLGRESPLGAGGEPGPALRDPSYSSSAARTLYSNPARPKPGMESRPRSPTIGTDAPAVYGVGGVGDGSPAESGGEIDPEGGDRADAYVNQPAAAKPDAGVDDEPDTKDIGLGARPADEESAG
jgi:hypothetical protein